MRRMARVEQITDISQLPAEHRPLYERINASRGHPGGPYSILLHAPTIADKVDQLSQTLRSVLSPHEFVLAALAVARAKDCVFVWSVQAPNARRAGVPEETITAIKERRLQALAADEADIVAYADQVVAASRVDDALFDRLRTRHGVPWLVGLTTTAGHFALIAGINNAFDVPPSPGGDKLY